MRDSRYQLSQVPLFRDLTPGELALLEFSVEFRTHRPEAVIFMPDDYQDQEVTLAIVEGKAAIFAASSGARTIRSLAPAGVVLGNVSSLGQRTSGIAVVALTNCTTCTMPWELLKRLMVEHPEVSMRLVQAMELRVGAAEESIEHLSARSTRVRLAELLLWLTRRPDADTPIQPHPDSRVVRGLTHQLLADLLGASRETVTTLLNQFEALGMIDIRRRCITICDMDRLASLVDEPGAGCQEAPIPAYGY